MKKLLISLLLCSVTAKAQSPEPRLYCSVSNMTHGKVFILSQDLKLTVSTFGWGTTIFLEDSPVTIKKGVLTTKETLVFEGEELQESSTTKEMIRIAEESEQFVLLIDKTPISAHVGGTNYVGKLLKGADTFEAEGEKIIMDELACFGSATALEF